MLYSVGVVQRTPCKRNPNTNDPRDGESKAQPGKHQLGKHSIQYLKDFLPPFLPFSFFSRQKIIIVNYKCFISWYFSQIVFSKVNQVFC